MIKKLFGNIDLSLFFITILVFLTIISIGIIFPANFSTFITAFQSFITLYFGWLFILIVAVCIIFMFWCGFSKYGNIKLGKDHETPEYSTLSWIAMLFSCGMGAGFIFWGAAEPIYHYMQPPYLFASATPESAIMAIQIAIFHWGLHGWALFGVTGLAIAYSCYRLDQPLTIGTALFGILGEKTRGKWGKIINFLSIFSTIFGTCTTLGVGIISIGFAIKFIFNIEIDATVTFGILLFLITTYLLTTIIGINRGMKFFSRLNIYLGSGLLFFIFVCGPTLFFFNLIINAVGAYLDNFIFMTFWSDPIYQGPWLGYWTIFYWSWCLSWIPSVGGFIAKISRGRTIREFVLAIMLVPTSFAILWFSIVGGAAIHAERTSIIPMWEAVQNEIGSGIFMLLTLYPFTTIISILVAINLTTFVVTSADAAAYYVSTIMSKGSLEPKTPIKIICAVFIGILSLFFILNGGIKALQTASIIAGFPFAFIMPLIIYSLIKMLRLQS